MKSLCLGTALVLLSAVTTTPRHHILFTRIGPVSSQLFLARADGTGEQPLLDNTGLDYSPAFSPDGAWIVFTSERNGSADIYRVRPDGSGLQRLTDDPAFDDQAAVAPNGQTLAFVSSRGGGKAHIWLLDVESRVVRLLTPSSGSEFRPAWSPDGRWLAFSTDRDAAVVHVPGSWEHLQSTTIAVIRPDGSGLRIITGGRGIAGSPRWSLDGKRLIYYETTQVAAWSTKNGDPVQGATQLVAVDVETGAKTPYTEGNGIRLWPQWLSDGGLAFLMMYPGGDAHVRLLHGDHSTDGPRGQLRNPSWSPDGRQVVYQKLVNSPTLTMRPEFSRQSDFDLTRMHGGLFLAFSPTGDRLATGRSHNGPNDVSLDLMRPDGTEDRTLLYRDGLAAFSPAWSPDGQQIAFSIGKYFRLPGRLVGEVGLINADGSDARTLISDPSNNGFPSWSPDGKRLVYKKDDHLAVLTLADHLIVDLTPPGAQHDNFPEWSPKGDWIVFTSDRDSAQEFKLFLVRPDGTHLRRLTDAPGDAHGSWSPDGEWVVFSSARTGFKDERCLLTGIPQPYGEIFVVKPDGSGLRQLTDNKWEDGAPVWAPSMRATLKTGQR